MSVSFDDVLAGLGSKAVDALKVTLADSWASLTDEERAAATKLLVSLARAHLLALAGQDTSGELAVLEAAFLQWKVVGKQVVIDGVKTAATTVFGLAGAFAGSALAGAIKGGAL